MMKFSVAGRGIASFNGHPLPMWTHLLAAGEAGYRIRSSSDGAGLAWAKIEARLFEDKQDKAA